MSEAAMMGPFCVRQVLPLKLKGVEESQQCGVRSSVLQTSVLGAALRGGCVSSGRWACPLPVILLGGERVRVYGEGPQLWGAPW